MTALGFVSIYWTDPATGEIEAAESLECVVRLDAQRPQGFYIERSHAEARGAAEAMSRWLDRKVLWKFSRSQIHYPDRTCHGEATLRASTQEFSLTDVVELSDSCGGRLYLADEAM